MDARPRWARPHGGPQSDRTRNVVMSKTIIATAAAAAVAAATLALGFIAPANAASIGVTDPADVDHGVDLRAVRVVNGELNLKIVLNHEDLVRSPKSGAGGAV